MTVRLELAVIGPAFGGGPLFALDNCYLFCHSTFQLNLPFPVNPFPFTQNMLFTFMRALLHLFAPSKILTLLASTNSALCVKKKQRHGGIPLDFQPSTFNF